MRPPGLSGYLAVYNDWDALAPSLASMAPWLDELVVVDGGYQWMAEYLTRIGRDPARSDAPVYQALAAFPKPVTIISRVWRNEIEKRMAGYQACTRRHVFRLDADEVIFMDEARLAAFMRAPAAVARMEMPLYAAPGWIRTTDASAPIERQACLFDADRIGAAEHLDYLWLVLTADSLPVNRPVEDLVFAEPIAFNAHLAAFRSPDTSHLRSAFYQTNFMRSHGVPWLPALVGRPIADTADLLEHVSAGDFLAMMDNSPIAANLDLASASKLRPSPLTSGQEACLLPVMARYFASHARRNAGLRTASRPCAEGSTVCFDISRPETLAPLVSEGRITLHYSTPGYAALAKVHCLMLHEPWQKTFTLACEHRDRRVAIVLPPDLPPPGACALRVLTVQLFWNGAAPVQYFSLAPPS